MWTAPAWTHHLAIALTWFALIAMACINPASWRIRGRLHHPTLVAVKVWGLAHLLANGDAGAMLLFGLFLWAVFDSIAVKKRGEIGAPRIASVRRADATALGAGTLAYVAVSFLHPVLFGVAVIGG